MGVLDRYHPNISLCTRGTDRKRRILVEEESREVAATYFRAYVNPIDIINSFRYLGRIFITTDDDWPEVIVNL